MSVQIQKGVLGSLANSNPIRKAEEEGLPPQSLSSKIERMGRLLQDLAEDLKEDISEAAKEIFNERITRQFQWYEEIANLRASMKREANIDEVFIWQIAQFNQKYKCFISNTPPFELAARIKAISGDFAKLYARINRQLWVDEWVDERAGECYIRSLNKKRVAYKCEGRIDPEKRGEWKTIWRKLQKGLLEAYQRARLFSSPSTFHTLTWVTGTTTATLVPIMRMQIPKLHGPALIPTGLLIKNGIVPLTGELWCGLQADGVNQQRLSGCRFPKIFIAKEYSDKGKADGLFSLSRERMFAEGYMEDKPSSDPFVSDYFSRMQIAVMRLLFARAQGQEGATQALLSLKPLIQKKIAKNSSTCAQKEILPSPFKNENAILTDFITLIDSEDRYKKMDEEEAFFVEKPSGLIFGSWTLNPDTDFFHIFGSTYSEEVHILGPQKFGETIQVVFAEEEALERVKKYIDRFPAPFRIQVLSMKALNYLAISVER